MIQKDSERFRTFFP